MLHEIRRLSLQDAHALHAQGFGTACQRAEPRGRPVYVKHRIVHRAHSGKVSQPSVSRRRQLSSQEMCTPNPGQFTRETKRPIRAKRPWPGCGLHGIRTLMSQLFATGSDARLLSSAAVVTTIAARPLL